MAVMTQDAATEGEARSRDWTAVLASPWMLAVILLLAFAAYAPMLDDWFIGDDFWFLRGAQSTSFGDYALKSFDPRETGPEEFNRYRPLYPIAWKLQYEAFGLNALYYHATVVALHLACVVLAWFVFRRLLGEGGFANLATAIFALHPAYVDSIGWISGGNRVFAALPYIASILFYMKYLDRPASPAGEDARHDTKPPQAMNYVWYAASVLLYAVAMLMHSSTITLIAVLAVYTAFVAGKPKDALQWRWWLPFAPFALLAFGEAMVQMYVRDNIAAGEGFSIGGHMFTNYGWYFGMLAVPVETLMGSASLESFAERVKVFAGFVLIALAFAVAYRRPMWGLGIFAAAWFALALLPDSTFVFGKQGRLLYVPAFGGALLLITMIMFVRDLLPERALRIATAAAPYVVVVLVIGAAALSFGRTRGITDLADEYEAFAVALREERPAVGAGGTLYLVGAPARGAFSPDSQLTTLAQLYYGDINVVVIGPDQQPPPLRASDAVFTHTP